MQFGCMVSNKGALTSFPGFIISGAQWTTLTSVEISKFHIKIYAYAVDFFCCYRNGRSETDKRYARGDTAF